MTSDVNSIWNTCSENGKRKPWFVISVIGDSKSIVPSTWEKSIFQNSLIDTAKCANECWIFHMGGKGKLSQTVQKAVENYNEINGLTGDTGEKQGVHYNMWRNAQKANIELFKLQPSENAKKVRHSKSNKKYFTIPEENYIQIHTQLLKKIGEERVKIMRLNKDLTIEIPVIVIVAEGDTRTLQHVDMILQEKIPLILIKGSGKAADVISEFLVHGKKILKTKIPLLLGTHAHRGDLGKVKKVMRSIKKRKHLVSVYDITDPHRRTLSDTVTDAILSAWAVRGSSVPNKQTESSSASYELYPIPNLDMIASFVESPIPYLENQKLSTSETLSPTLVATLQSSAHTSLFTDISHGTPNTGTGSSQLDNSSLGIPMMLTENVTSVFSGSKTMRSENTWLNPSSFPLYFFVAYQLIQTHFPENSKEREINFEQLLVKAIQADKLDYVAVLIQEHDVELRLSSLPDLYNETVPCRLCQHDIDCQHVPSILLKKNASRQLFFFEESSCLEAARELCAEFLHYPRKTTSKTIHDNSVGYQDLLIWSLFANRPRLATLFWNACQDQLLTALLAYGVLKSMAVMATEYADQTVYKELVNHAKIFEKRSLDLQSELYKEYPKEAMEITLTEFTVWDITICPLDCAYNNDMYEFISDPCSQRCLNKIWYNELGTNINVALKMGFTCRQINGRHAVCRLLSAPFTKFVINYLVFFVGILLYSAFLLTNVRTINNIGGFEIFVYVWMLSDMVEEYLVPIYYRKQKTSGWSDKWYRFGRYINNFWNALDTLSYLLTFMAIGLRFTEVTLLWARRIYSFSLFLMFMRFLHFVLIYRKVGVYVILIKEMMRDLARFIVILIVFMLAIGVMYHVNKYPNHHDMWPPEIEKWRIWQIIYLPYWQIYGELMLEQVTGNKNLNSTCTYIDREHESNINRCEESDDWVLFVIAAFYMLLSNLLLVNLVIALFSARFEKVKANSEKLWRYIRYSYIMDYKIRVPAVFNVLIRPIMLVGLCCENRTCKCCLNEVNYKSQIDKTKQENYRHLRALQSICSVRCT